VNKRLLIQVEIDFMNVYYLLLLYNLLAPQIYHAVLILFIMITVCKKYLQELKNLLILLVVLIFVPMMLFLKNLMLNLCLELLQKLNMIIEICNFPVDNVNYVVLNYRWQPIELRLFWMF